MFEPRPKEPAYAFVPDVEAPATNRYGKPIETVPEGHELRGQSLNINGDDSVPDNPNRYKQHGFYFNAKERLAGSPCLSCRWLCRGRYLARLPAHEYLHGL